MLVMIPVSWYLVSILKRGVSMHIYALLHSVIWSGGVSASNKYLSNKNLTQFKLVKHSLHQAFVLPHFRRTILNKSSQTSIFPKYSNNFINSTNLIQH